MNLYAKLLRTRSHFGIEERTRCIQQHIRLPGLTSFIASREERETTNNKWNSSLLLNLTETTN